MKLLIHLASLLFPGAFAASNPEPPKRGRPSAAVTERRYANVDWSKTNREIAAQLGVSYQAVARARRTRGVPVGQCGRPPGTRLAKSDKRYAGVDWSQTDRQIAAQLGVSYQAVAYFRKSRGIPNARYKMVTV